MKFIKDLKEINKRDISIAGGKGANLGKMLKVGIPVMSRILCKLF
jgi:phosphoenolpyruvate synthase/pyruvate phosphate dikinase